MLRLVGLPAHCRSSRCRRQQAAGVGGPPPSASRRPRPGGCTPGAWRPAVATRGSPSGRACEREPRACRLF
eukprot:1745445-Alexandrium_andersonii.AAC.1